MKRSGRRGKKPGNSRDGAQRRPEPEAGGIAPARGGESGEQGKSASLIEMLEALKPHDHLCLIYESAEEWRAAAAPFIAIGLKRGEKCLYVVDTSTTDEIRRYLAEQGVDVASAEASGQLAILHHTEAYTKEGTFDPDGMLALLIVETEKAVATGYPALRVTGEMTWVVRGHPGSEKVLEYEAKLNRDLFPHYPCLAVCQYDRWKFDPEIIKGVVMTHPLLIKGNHVYRNFYYIPPEEFLNQKQAETEVQHWLNNLAREQRIEDSLRESEEKYRSLVTNIDTGIFRCTPGPRGRFLEANPAMERMTGYSREELLRIDVAQLYLKPKHRRERIKEAEQAGSVSMREIRCRKKDGSELVAADVMVPVRDSEGRVVHFDGILADITAQRRAEEELRRSEERFRLLAESTPEVIYLCRNDERWTMVYLNDAVERLTGHSRESFLSDEISFSDLYSPEDRDMVYSGVAEALEKGTPFHMIYRIVRADGTVRWVEEFGDAIRRNGSVEYLVGIVLDITERKQAEDALCKSEQFLQTTFDSVQDGISVLDTDLRILSVNRTMEKWYSPMHPLQGKKCYEAYQGRTEPCEVCPSLRSLETGRLERDEVPFVVDGEATGVLELYAFPMLDDTGKATGVVEYVRDVTERREAEEALSQSEERYRFLYENSPALNVIIGADGNIKDVNPLFITRFGYSKDDVVGRSVLDFIVPEDVEQAIEQLEADLRGEDTPPMEIGLYASDRSVRTVLFPADKALLYEGGQIAAILITGADVTEHKQAQHSIRRRSAILEAINSVLQETLQCETHEEVARKCLGVAQRLTGSEFGWIGQVNPSGRLDTIALSDPGWESCTIPDSHDPLLLRDMESRGIWGRVLKDGAPLITNDPQTHPDSVGLPTGHPALTAFLGVPLKDGDRTIGMIALANKPTGFELDDREAVETLSVALVEALRRKRAEEALARSERNFRDSMENSPLGIRIVTDDGKTLYVNKALLDLCGHGSLEELLAVPRKQIHTRESYAEHRKRVSMRRRGEQVPADYEASIVRKDGQVRHLWVSRKEVLWNGERRFQIVYQDITERKQAEEALKAQTAYFRQLFDSSPDAVVMLDTDDRVIRVNRGFEALFGYGSDEVTGRSISDLVIPGHLLEESSAFSEKVLRRGVVRKETVRRRRDGSLVDVLVVGYAIEIEGGLVGMYVTYSDITERKQAEKALRESEERYDALFDRSSDLIYVHDFEGNLLDANEATLSLTGYDREDLSRLNLADMLSEEQRADALARIQELIETGTQNEPKEYRVRCKDGSFVDIETRASVVYRDGEPYAIQGLARDLTERKRMEEQLVMTDRLASIGQLASGIAHELNNPLTSVIGFSDMLLSGDLPADVKEDLEVINSEARRTSDVVKGLLAFARKQRTDKAAVDVNSIIQSVLQLRAYEQRVSNIALDARLASDLPPVTGNGPQLQQVFVNMIINAEQAMIEAHGRGRLTVITELIGDTVRATIADDGPGIRPDVMSRLFTPFLTTKEVGKGTGLGLSICHGIVTEHGGNIYAESKPGEGATFVVELPAARR